LAPLGLLYLGVIQMFEKFPSPTLTFHEYPHPFHSAAEILVYPKLTPKPEFRHMWLGLSSTIFSHY